MQPIALGDESPLTCFVARFLLDRGYDVSFVGHGPSMEPIIPDNTHCHIRPLRPKERPQVGDTVFVDCGHGIFMLHMVHRNERGIAGEQYLIGWANSRYFDGWFSRRSIVGVYVGPVKEEHART